MRNKTLLRTNLLVCLIIIIGFAITSVISYQANIGIYKKDVEQVSTLTSEGIYNEIAGIFAQPVSVSLTMANDSLLKNFLAREKQNIRSEAYLQEMCEYLNGYKAKYNYDSVFLVSTNTNRYYHYEGLNRILVKDNPENNWYYDFLASDEEYSLNVDNDEVTDSNIITVFVNCKIKDSDGAILGVVGVGLQVESLQALLKTYEDEYGVTPYLVDNQGIIEISSTNTGYEKVNLFDSVAYADQKTKILTSRADEESFWFGNAVRSGYVVSQYEPNLNWHLIIENNTTGVKQSLYLQLFGNILIILAILVLVLITITGVMKKYHSQIMKLNSTQELEYQKLLHETTEGLYENIFELDLTRNVAGGESTKRYFEKIGLNAEASYDMALHVIAKKHIKEEYVQNYLEIFSSEHVMAAYNSGINNLSCDVMMASDGVNYHWMRISARIFFWNSDKSVRMITYRQDIDEEKKRELMLLEGSQRDDMTGLYNKRTTEEMIETTLVADLSVTAVNHFFLIFDIDNFKTINDSMGHGFGDHVIIELAAEIKRQFREYDVVGRIGGDEFAVLMKNVESVDALTDKMERVCARLRNKDFGQGQVYHISCSIGVAMFRKDGNTYSELFEKADRALYYAKGHGKASFSIYGDSIGSHAFNVSQRDLETLINVATDGIAKIACSNPLTCLYFNQKCMELSGVAADVLVSAAYNPLTQIHQDDLPNLVSVYQAALLNKESFTIDFRLIQQSGNVVPIEMKGLFISELYEDKYPILYLMLTKQLPKVEASQVNK